MNELPIRKFNRDSDTKLIAFYNIALYIGVVSKQILSKRAIMTSETAYVELHKVIINRNVNRLTEIQSIIGTEDITSVDIYGELEDCRQTISILDDYNKSIKKNQINLNNTFIFDDRNTLDLTYTELADKFNAIIEGINNTAYPIYGESIPLLRNTETDNKIAKAVIKEVSDLKEVESSIETKVKGANKRKDKATGKLKAVAMRSINTAEERLHIYTTNEDIEISKFATIINYKEDCEVEAYLPAYYNINDLDVTRLKLYKISKYKIKELFKKYVKTYFEINEIWKKECKANNVVFKQTNLIRVKELLMSNAFDSIAEALQYLFDKEIYISVNLRKSFDIVEAYNKYGDDPGKINTTLSNSIEIDSFVTPNLMVDIDKEVEKAFEIVRKQAMKII